MMIIKHILLALELKKFHKKSKLFRQHKYNNKYLKNTSIRYKTYKQKFADTFVLDLMIFYVKR